MQQRHKKRLIFDQFKRKLRNKTSKLSFSYTIPLAYIMILCLFSVFVINPNIRNDSAFATDESSSSDTAIMPTSLSYTALTIGGDALDKQVTVAPGSVGYRNHTITIATSQLSNYTLTISGPVGLTSTGGSTITGAGGKTPTGTNSMPDNSWGYAYGQTGTSESMTYSSFTGTNQTLDTISSSNVNTSISTNDTTKNLSFAVKFADNAISTNYTGKVVLSLIATPKS